MKEKVKLILRWDWCRKIGQFRNRSSDFRSESFTATISE